MLPEHHCGEHLVRFPPDLLQCFQVFTLPASLCLPTALIRNRGPVGVRFAAIELLYVIQATVAAMLPSPSCRQSTFLHFLLPAPNPDCNLNILLFQLPRLCSEPMGL